MPGRRVDATAKEPPTLMDDRFLDHCYEIAGKRIDPVVGRIRCHGEDSPLGRRALEVLAILASAAGEMVPHEAFIERVWDGDALVGRRGLTDTIYALRRLLEDTSIKTPVIRTVPRRGYKLIAEARLLEDERGLSFYESWDLPGRPGWRLVRLLSENELSETWLAERSGSEHGSSAESGKRVFRFCRNQAHLRRLRREVELLRYLREKLADRVDVVSMLDWQLEEPPYWLEMEHTAHGSLADWAEARGGLARSSLHERVRLITQAASVLESVHSAGVVHRRISPASLLIDERAGEPVAKIGEFGLGELVASGMTSTSHPEMKAPTADLTLSSDGSARASYYRPPEGESGRPAGDVYAFGVVLYQVATGDLQRAVPARGPETIGSPTLREIIADCLAERPARRPSAGSLCRRLEALPLEAAPAEQLPSHAEAAKDPSAGREHADSPAEEAAKPRPVILRPREAIGETVGAFRLLDVLGEGGMGTVYLAEQREPVERRVALKLIRAGMDSSQVLARFEAERQALALMDHANVAAVYDAGASASGHPYFAMEHVQGLEITAHCDLSKLGLRPRVELFLQVCDGVQHAHQKGLIHRDLKPSNLLVKNPPGQSATVKIIDFGVAKSLQRKLTASTVHTRLGTFVGTPSYSSPEQISGHQVDVDTRADIYSLGIVLYELLAGVTPYSPAELEGKTPLELIKLLSEGDPPTPLARFSSLAAEDEEAIARSRSASVERLKRSLGTDVAWIINKCLERDPDDRYASVLELKKDLQRWLEDRPVEARPATRAYRLRKLVKRHRTAVTLTAIAALTLVTTTSVAVFGLVRAERQAAKAQIAALEAEKAAEFQVNQLQSLDPSSMGSGLRSLLLSRFREKMLEKGLETRRVDQAEEQLDQWLGELNFVDLTLEVLDGHFFEPAIEVVDQEYEDFPELQARLWQSIADTLLKLGAPARAAEPQELAMNRRRSVLGPGHPLTLESTLQRGSVLHGLGKFELARRDFETALSGLRQNFGEDDERTLEARETLGEFLLYQYEWEEARDHFNAVLEARRRLLGPDHPDTLSVVENLGTLGFWTGEFETAERYYDEALAGMRRVLGEADRVTLETMAQAAAVYSAQGDLERAVAVLNQAIEGMRAQLGEAHPTTTKAIHDLAVFLAQHGELERAEPLFEQALASSRKSLGLESSSTMTTVASLGRLMAETGRLKEAEKRLYPAVEVFRRVLGLEHHRTQFYLYQLGKIYRERGRLEEAEAIFRELASFQAKDEENTRALYVSSDLARVLLLQGELDAAETLQLEMLEKLRNVLGPEHNDTLRTQSYLAEVWMRRGRFEEAESSLRQILERVREDPGLEHEDSLFTMRLLSRLLREQGELEEARALGEEALRVGSGFYHQNDHRLAGLKLDYGQTLEELGRSNEAAPMLREARRSMANAGLAFDQKPPR